MQVRDISTGRSAGAMPTEFVSTALATRNTTQPRTPANQTSSTQPASDIISLSSEAALKRGSALAP